MCSDSVNLKDKYVRLGNQAAAEMWVASKFQILSYILCSLFAEFISKSNQLFTDSLI